MVEVRDMGNRSKAYKFVVDEDVEVNRLVVVPRGSEEMTILCAGPNPIYYHTEGNPPGLGKDDNGDIQPNHVARFTIHAMTAYMPKVYIRSSHGPTTASVYCGPISLGQGPDLIAIADRIRKLFP